MAASVMLLASCSPDDVSGVKLSENGAPVLENCGAYFRGVEAYDAETGRLIWSASKPQSSSDYGVGQVEVGVLPDADWVETSPLNLEPLPAVWRFVVSRRNFNDPETLAATHAGLSTDQVFIFESGKRVPADEFLGQTCGYDPPIPPAVTGAVAGVLAGAVILAAGVVGARRARRRHLRP